ncbi:MAG: hypothetical protein HKN25_17235 [Pyrinomonadaceae bacterium]|nr:hypothetical protein [Pyrinomonadaceae bacterium]
MAIILGIDGIGAMSKFTGADHFRNSFVRRIVENSGSVSQEKLYLRGPKETTGNIEDAIDTGYRFVRSRFRAAQSNSPVLLTGYSRGAAGVIILAGRLKQRNISVNAMLLFDAVGRFAESETISISKNVKNVMHVRRRADSGSLQNLRSVGTRASSDTNYEEKFFRCTHGAIGGVPWAPQKGEALSDLIDESPLGASVSERGEPTKITFQQDAKASRDVWNHVQSFRGKHNYF